MRERESNLEAGVRPTRIPRLFRPIEFQAIAMAIFFFGAIFGIIGDDWILFVPIGVQFTSEYTAAALVIFALSLVLLLFSSFVRPIRLRSEVLTIRSPWQAMASTVLLVAGLILLKYNIERLSVFELILENPGAIAFNLIDAKGSVLFFSSMSAFYVGAAGILDQTRNRYFVVTMIMLIIAYTIGVLLTTRRDLALVAMTWGAFVLLQRLRLRVSIIIILPAAFALFYVVLGFRNIDLLRAPFEYFTSGEFEPIRFSLYLTNKWIDDVTFISPIDYSLPFVADGKIIGQVNAKFSDLIFGNPSALGLPTVTIYSSILYFWGLVPIVFYLLHVLLVRQIAYVVQRRTSYVFSYLYVFSLVRLLLFIRNGELFESFIDTIVVGSFFFFYSAFSKWSMIFGLGKAR